MSDYNQKSKSNNANLPIMARMSTKITILIAVIVLVTVVVQVLVARNRASTAMESTYLNYAQNLAEEAAISVDFATEFGEKAYGGYAMNLAQEAAISINFSREFGESVYKSYAQNLAEEAAKAVDLASVNGPLSVSTVYLIVYFNVNHAKRRQL